MILLYEILNKHKKCINYVTIHLTNPINIILPASGRDFWQEWINWILRPKTNIIELHLPNQCSEGIWSEDYKQQFTPTQVFPTELFGAFNLSKYTEKPQKGIWNISWDHGLHKASNNSECNSANNVVSTNTGPHKSKSKETQDLNTQCPGGREGWASIHSKAALFCPLRSTDLLYLPPTVPAQFHALQRQASNEKRKPRWRKLTVAALTGSP